MKNYPLAIKSFDEITKEFDLIYIITFKKNEEYANINDELFIELNRKFVLELVASFEAKSVYFFKNFVKRRSSINVAYNSSISINTRNAIKIGQKPLMYCHIIPVFKAIIQPIDTTIYSDFIKLVEYRNWLAHGRGWDIDNNWKKIDFQYSLQIISSLMNNLPGYPDSLKK